MADNKNDEELKKAFERLDKSVAPIKQSLDCSKKVKMEYRGPEIYKTDFSEMFPKVSFDFSDYKSPAETIEEMKKELEKSNQAISDVKAELQKERDSHRHDTIKNIVINIGVAILTVVLTILATKFGLLQ